MMQLSRYFTLEQLTHSDTAKAHGISNQPDVFAQGNLSKVALLLDLIYDQIGPFRITSGYRSQALNDLLQNSSSTSLHMRGMAADLLPLTMTADQFFWKLAASPLKNSCGEIINEAAEEGVVHVSIPYERGAGILKYLENGSYYQYTPAEIQAKLGGGSNENENVSPSFSLESASLDLPVIPILLTAGVLGGLAFMVMLQQRRTV